MKISILSLFIIYALVLSSCRSSRPAQQTAPSKSLLFPTLQKNFQDLTAFQLKTKEQEIQLSLQNGVWQIDEPYEVPAYAQLVQLALVDFISATRGHVVELNQADLPDLGLISPDEIPKDSSANPVEVTFFFGDKQPKITCILGEFDLSNESEDSMIYGEQATARRYVYFPDKRTAYRTSSSFQYATPSASSWEGRELPALKNLRKIDITLNDGFSWSAQRTSSYSPIQFTKPFESIGQDESLINLFEQFLSTGIHGGILLHSTKSPEETLEPIQLSITAQDHDGTIYQLQVGKPNQIAKVQHPGNELGQGMIGLEESKKEAIFYPAKISLTRQGKALPGTSYLTKRIVRLPKSEIEMINLITNRLQTHLPAPAP